MAQLDQNSNLLPQNPDPDDQLAPQLHYPNPTQHERDPDQTEPADDADEADEERFPELMARVRLDRIPSLSLKVRHRLEASRASQTISSEDLTCKVVGEILCGSFNAVQRIEFSDGVAWALKMPGTGYPTAWNDAARMQWASGLQTMQFVKNKTSVPVPELIYFTSSLVNELGCPYAFMQWVDGDDIYDVWGQDAEPDVACERRRVRMLLDLASSVVQLGNVTSHMAGTPMFNEGANISGLGPVLKHEYLDFGERPQSISVGPFVDSKSFMTCMQQRRDDGLSTDLDTHLPKPNSLRFVVDVLLQNADQAEPFALMHPDLNLQNVLVDGNGRVRALIDWDKACFVPRCLSRGSYPMWINRDWMSGYFASDAKHGFKQALFDHFKTGVADGTIPDDEDFDSYHFNLSFMRASDRKVKQTLEDPITYIENNEYYDRYRTIWRECLRKTQYHGGYSWNDQDIESVVDEILATVPDSYDTGLTPEKSLDASVLLFASDYPFSSAETLGRVFKKIGFLDKYRPWLLERRNTSSLAIPPDQDVLQQETSLGNGGSNLPAHDNIHHDTSAAQLDTSAAVDKLPAEENAVPSASAEIPGQDVDSVAVPAATPCASSNQPEIYGSGLVEDNADGNDMASGESQDTSVGDLPKGGPQSAMRSMFASNFNKTFGVVAQTTRAIAFLPLRVLRMFPNILGTLIRSLSSRHAGDMTLSNLGEGSPSGNGTSKQGDSPLENSRARSGHSRRREANSTFQELILSTQNKILDQVTNIRNEMQEQKSSVHGQLSSIQAQLSSMQEQVSSLQEQSASMGSQITSTQEQRSALRDRFHVLEEQSARSNESCVPKILDRDTTAEAKDGENDGRGSGADAENKSGSDSHSDVSDPCDSASGSETEHCLLDEGEAWVLSYRLERGTLDQDRLERLKTWLRYLFHYGPPESSALPQRRVIYDGHVGAPGDHRTHEAESHGFQGGQFEDEGTYEAADSHDDEFSDDSEATTEILLEVLDHGSEDAQDSYTNHFIANDNGLGNRVELEAGGVREQAVENSANVEAAAERDDVTHHEPIAEHEVPVEQQSEVTEPDHENPGFLERDNSSERELQVAVGADEPGYTALGGDERRGDGEDQHDEYTRQLQYAGEAEDDRSHTAEDEGELELELEASTGGESDNGHEGTGEPATPPEHDHGSEHDLGHKAMPEMALEHDLGVYSGLGDTSSLEQALEAAKQSAEESESEQADEPKPKQSGGGGNGKPKDHVGGTRARARARGKKRH